MQGLCQSYMGCECGATASTCTCPDASAVKGIVAAPDNKACVWDFTIDGPFSMTAASGSMFGLPFKVSNGKVCPGLLYGPDARVVSSFNINVESPLAACPQGATYTALEKYSPQAGEPCSGPPDAFDLFHLFSPPTSLAAGTCYNAEVTLTDSTTHAVVLKYNP
jgi:hypothetical protein